MLNNNVFNLPITCQTVCQSSCNLCLVNFSSFFHLFKNFSGAFSMNLLRDVFKPVMALKQHVERTCICIIHRQQVHLQRESIPGGGADDGECATLHTVPS